MQLDEWQGTEQSDTFTLSVYPVENVVKAKDVF